VKGWEIEIKPSIALTTTSPSIDKGEAQVAWTLMFKKKKVAWTFQDLAKMVTLL
jgi:hypothetical protein